MPNIGEIDELEDIIDLVAEDTSAIGKLNARDELWRIFTFYTLHSDSTNLETMKISLFVKFCKDVQIVNKRFTGTQIELELAKILRQLRGHEVRVGATFITFPEFMAVLESMAPKVYTNCTNELAIRRLLLENVFLLAGRRNEIMHHDIDNEAACSFVQGPIRRALEEIFKHYVSLGELHRTYETAAAVHGAPPPTLREIRSQITFREFHQFSLDYNLKSTHLLTGMQIGHAYLCAVPMRDDMMLCQGMKFDMFLKAIIHLALLGFGQHYSPEITPLLKVKALMLHMWKLLNKNETALKAVKANTKMFGSSRASFNLYGSSVFSDHFLKIWMADEFSEYVIAIVNPVNAGLGEEVVTRIDDVAARADDDASLFTPMGDEGPGSPAGTTTSDAARLINAIGNVSAGETSDDGERPVKFAPGSTVTLDGEDLALLLKRKPEIAELLILELNALALGR